MIDIYVLEKTDLQCDYETTFRRKTPLQKVVNISLWRESLYGAQNFTLSLVLMLSIALLEKCEKSTLLLAKANKKMKVKKKKNYHFEILNISIMTKEKND